MGTRTSFGERLRAARIRKGLSVRKLVEKSGVTKSQICRLEAGDQDDPRLSTLVRLTRALDVSLDELAGLDQMPGPTVKNAGLRDLAAALLERLPEG